MTFRLETGFSDWKQDFEIRNKTLRLETRFLSLEIRLLN